MKTVAFIVKINVELDDAYTIQQTQNEVFDACQRSGLAVASVVPWSRSTLEQGTSPFSSNEPAGGLSLPDVGIPSL